MARPLRRLILISLGALAGLLLLTALAVAAVVLFVDADTFRPRIEQVASRELGRPVSLGRLRWDPGWHMGVASEGGAVANAPGFGDVPLAAWQRIGFGIALRPLMRREVLIDHIEIEGLALDLARAADGSNNWTFAPAQPAAPDAAPGRETRIAVEGIRIRDGRVVLRDAASAAEWRLDGLALSVDLAPGPTLLPQEVTDVDFEARLHGGPLPETGVAIELAAPRVAFDAATPTLAVPAFRARLDQARLEGSLALADAQTASARFELAMPSVRALLASVGIEPPLMRDPDTLGAMRAQGELRYAAGAIAVAPLSLVLDDTTLEGEIRVGPLSPPVLRFTLAADEADIDRYLEPPEVQGEPLELPVAQLESLDARGELRVREARLAGSIARDVLITVE